MSTTPFATIADIEARHPAELLVLAADETTGLRDDARVEASIASATAVMLLILKGRYASSELARLDPESRDALKSLAIDITLYKVALSFARSTDRLEKGYETAIKRLEGLVAGKGGLSFEGSGGDGAAPASAASPNEVLIVAPERVFTRDRFRGL